MKITREELVTRTYCDICAAEITHKNQVGSSYNDATNYVVCMDNRFDVDIDGRKGITLTCEMLAKLYDNYPKLMNQTFADRGRTE